MHSTTVFASPDAAALNLRVEVAQVGVSMLGKMLRILRLLPGWPVISASSGLTSENAGAVWPACGKSPLAGTGLPQVDGCCHFYLQCSLQMPQPFQRDNR